MYRKRNHRKILILGTRICNWGINLKASAGLSVAAILLGILVLSSVVLSFSSTGVLISSSGSIQYISPLRVEGQYLKDDYNNTVILRGVSCGDLGDSPDGTWSGVQLQTYSDWQANQADVIAELNAIKSWGCNMIRVMGALEYWVYNMGNNIQMLKDLANLCAARGMYLLYDHWSVRGWGDGSSQDPLPYPPYQTSTNANAVVPSEQAYINIMASEAANFTGYPNVILGLWNEPNGSSGGNVTDWMNVAQQCITAMRATGFSGIIDVEWSYGLWCNLQNQPPAPPTSPSGGSASVLDWVYDYPLSGSNIVYETHYYDGIQYPSGVGGGVGYGGLTYSQTVQGFEDCWVKYVTQTLNKPVFVGEVGADIWYSGQDLSDELTSFNNTLQVLNAWGIGYCGWEWRAGMEYSLISSDSAYTPTSAGTILQADIAATPSLQPPT